MYYFIGDVLVILLVSPLWYPILCEPFGHVPGSKRRSTWACIWVVKAEAEAKVLIFTVGVVEGEAESNPLGLVEVEVEGNSHWDYY